MNPHDKRFCLARLQEIAQLEADWDREGAQPIATNVICAARQFIEDLPDGETGGPMVVPMHSGGVQLEWHAGGRVLEIEFGRNGVAFLLDSYSLSVPFSRCEELHTAISSFHERTRENAMESKSVEGLGLFDNLRYARWFLRNAAALKGLLELPERIKNAESIEEYLEIVKWAIDIIKPVIGDLLTVQAAQSETTVIQSVEAAGFDWEQLCDANCVVDSIISGFLDR
jgi:hypothetical protein